MKYVLLASLVVAAACSDSSGPAPQTPHTRFVTVAAGIRLEVVDYGGSGEPLVLLAGSGNTAHVFATFAWRFTDRYHVVALTRRGFGASSKPAAGYDTRTLAEDVRIVLDSLRLTKVSIMGHSLAGDEMTRLAGDHPERVRKLVYLDAAYDRVALGAILQEFPLPAPPAPSANELASKEGFGRYVQRVRGVSIPADEISASFTFASDGSLVGEVTPPAVYAALLGSEEAPDYARVTAPSLGIYAVAQDAGDVVPWLTPASEDWPVAQEVFSGVFAPFYDGERARFRTGVARNQVIEMPAANHYVFLSDAAQVASAVRSFLQQP
ncbi:MAG: alpha/beta hydrolase [Gemmatimonadaceae bacterium]